LYVDGSTIIALAAFLTAVFTLFKYYNKVFCWIKKQEDQDKDIESIKKELTLICYSQLACLEGLKQLNCNGPVTEARNKLEKHLNKSAHDQEE
jgi:hypothetical protein